MPTLRDVTVHVTDDRGNISKEWGPQFLRSQNKVSAYIKSTTDMPFRVSVQPMIPYIDPDVPTSNASSSRRTWSNTSDESYNRRGESEWTHKHKGSSFSSPTRPQKRYDSPCAPNFDFLASLYVDGRQVPERRTVVYLDPRDRDFNPPDGKIRFRSRWVQSQDGSMKEHAWVFRDVGIEASFGKLFISKNGHAAEDFEEPIEDALVRGLDSTDLSADTGPPKQETGKVGQIVVTLQRIQLGRKSIEPEFRAKHREDEKDDFDMGGIEQEITHTTGLTHVGTLPPQPIRVVDFYPYKRGEGVYATFQFFYRSQERLEKFNFAGFPRKEKRQPRKRGQLNMDMANKTPLSIAYAKQGNPKPLKSTGRAYEENVRDKTFRDSEHAFKFDDGYRDKTAIASKNKSSPVDRQTQAPDAFPLAPLKFGVRNKTPHGQKNARFAGQEEIIEDHSSMSSPKEDEKREDRSITPPSTSSPGSSYSPPLSMTTYMNTNPLLPKGPYDPINSTSSPMKENIRTGPQSARDHHSPITSTTGSTKLRPPTPHPTVSLFPQDCKTADTLAALSKQIGNNSYRKTAQSSDADDERDDSDLEIQPADDEKDQDISDPDDFWSADKDDEGLHGQLEAVRISPKKRALEDEEEDENAVEKNEEGRAANTLEDGEIKEEIRGDDGELVGARGRRNAITEEDKKAIEEFKRVKRVKTVAEDALVVP